jgi:uncharacterized protein DUF4124
MKKLLLLVLVATSAQGEIYTWTDSRGIAHYTNSMYEVPGRYRERVRVLDLGLGPKTEQSATPPSGPASPAPQQSVPPPATTLRQEEPASPMPTPGKGSRRQRGTRSRVESDE